MISNYAFADGNKRIGMYVLLAFLETNGIKLRPKNAEVARVGLAIAAGEMKYEELLYWILENEVGTTQSQPQFNTFQTKYCCPLCNAPNECVQVGTTVFYKLLTVLTLFIKKNVFSHRFLNDFCV